MYVVWKNIEFLYKDHQNGEIQIMRTKDLLMLSLQ